MALNRLVIRNLRNIKACDLDVSSGFNFLIGPNGSGKTSILEAIYYLGHGRSFRTHLASRVIHYQQEALTVFADIAQDHAAIPVGIRKYRDGTTDFKMAGEKGRKLVQLADILPMQLIHPDGFELLTGGPSFRRAFMDWGVFHLESEFYSVWARVKRLTKQRNALLRQGADYRQVQYWDKELVSLAEQIDFWRQNYVARWAQKAQVLCQAFLPEYIIKLNYSRGWDKSTNYAQLLQDNFERDQDLGYTLSGPHRADLRFRIDGVPVNDVLSRGQLKLMVCALRLAQGQQLSQDNDKQCIYLLDDLASELDSQRRLLLIAQLKQIKAQVFISAISVDHVAEMYDDQNSKMFHIEHGKIVTD